MARKHRKRSQRRPERKGQKRDIKEEPFGTEDPELGTEVWEQQSSGIVWSEPVLDPTGCFTYRTLAMPNGEIFYHIDGPQTYNEVQPTIWSDFQNNGLNGPVAATSSYDNFPVPKNNQSRRPKSGENNSAKDKILIERYSNDDINIITSTSFGTDGDDEIVVTLEGDSDIEIRPVSKHSGSRRIERPTRKHRSRHEKYGSHETQDTEYDERMARKGSQARLKVSDWLTQSFVDTSM